MEDDFFQELDQSISNISADKCWQKDVGGFTLWFSPVDYKSNLLIQEKISEMEGITVLYEMKRLALSYSIVGINKIDLRPYRYAPPSFNVNGRKVNLSSYIYEKIAQWDNEFVDAAFKVFGDLMESDKNQILKDVQFENEKPPLEELTEIEARSAELREQLGLPRLVEETIKEKKSNLHDNEEYEDADYDEDDDISDQERREILEESEPLRDDTYYRNVKASQEDSKESVEIKEDYDPFRIVASDTVKTAPVQQPFVQPVQTVPVPVPPTKTAPRKSVSMEEIENPHLFARPSDPNNPAKAMPSVDDSEVIEDKTDKTKQNLVFDKAPQGNKNPRFVPPKRL